MANNIMYYDSPIGRMVLVSDAEGLCGVYFVGQKYDRAGVGDVIEQEDEYLLDAKRWLDIYFQGKVPDFLPNLHMTGSEFQLEVWNQLLQIPYGQTTTYGSIASHCKKNICLRRQLAVRLAEIKFLLLCLVIESSAVMDH